MRPRYTTAPDGTQFRDLDGTGVMEPWKDPRRLPVERAADLLLRLSAAEKAGLMFHTVLEVGADGVPLTGPGRISKRGTSELVLTRGITHVNVHALPSARLTARWVNAVQEIAERAPHGIPVTISTDPRHGYLTNVGASFAADHLSQWPEPLGMAALGDVAAVAEYADVCRREYLALGIRCALGPMADLATEPRWCRQSGTFGQDSVLAAELVSAYVHGMQGESLGRSSIACTTKHFPGAGPQAHGEDAHFPYGSDQVYPGGRFEEHLAPFRSAISAGTAAIMPYYARPLGLVRGGEAIEEVGFGYNRQIITDLLREELGYSGVVLSDWELIGDNVVKGQVLPARAWGVEHLSAPERMLTILQAGVDQFGGEDCVELLLELVEDGRVRQARIDASAQRLLTVKFALGLFDDPYVDEDEAERVVGAQPLRELGLAAQRRSVVALSGADRLPLTPGRVYCEGLAPQEAARLGTPAHSPQEADFAVVRVSAPYEHRDDLFLESSMHAGSLDFSPGFIYRMQALGARVPLILDVTLDRPAILAPLRAVPAILTASFGTSDAAYVDVLCGLDTPRGRLPFDLPESMDAVRNSREDVPGDTPDALYRCGWQSP